MAMDVVSRPPYVTQGKPARLLDMAGITLSMAQSRLDAYLDAEAAVLSGQRYEINGRVLWRADLAEIRAGIETWNQRVQQLSRRAVGRSKAVVLSPRF